MANDPPEKRQPKYSAFPHLAYYYQRFGSPINPIRSNPNLRCNAPTACPQISGPVPLPPEAPLNLCTTRMQQPLPPIIPSFRTQYRAMQNQVSPYRTTYTEPIMSTLQQISTRGSQSTTTAIYPNRLNATSSNEFLEQSVVQLVKHENFSPTESHGEPSTSRSDPNISFDPENHSSSSSPSSSSLNSSQNPQHTQSMLVSDESDETDENEDELTYNDLKCKQDEKDELEEIRKDLARHEGYQKFVKDEMKIIRNKKRLQAKGAKLDKTDEFIPKNKNPKEDKENNLERQKRKMAVKQSRAKSERLADLTSINIKFIKERINAELKRWKELKIRQLISNRNENNSSSSEEETENPNTPKRSNT